MTTDTSDRRTDPTKHATERSAAEKAWDKLLDDKLKVIQYLMSISDSTIKPFKLLILVDLQGIYLSLHRWLSEWNVPIDDGMLLSRFAHFQIERTSKDVAVRLVNMQPGSTGDLRQLFDSIKINYDTDKPYLGKQVDVLKGGTYLDIETRFEMFYAPVPLREIEWKLRMHAKKGSSEARHQLNKAGSGILKQNGVFERDYKAYDDFVSRLRESTYYSCSQEGFFGYYVGEHGLNNFKEKEVDIRIAVRVMDALHGREADAICIISSDQDFLPLHKRADDFGVKSFQADLSKLWANDRIGSKFKGMKERYIRGGVDPEWPLKVLSEALSAPGLGYFAKYKYSEQEIHALCRLHNEFNEVKIHLDIKPDGKADLKFSRPK